MKVNKFYIDGTWTTPSSNKTMPVINPANLETHAIMACATESDVSDAAAAAHRAFPGWANTSGMERSDFMFEIADKMESRKEDFVEAHVQTMGIPRHLAYEVQIEGPIQAVRYYADLARKIDSEQDEDGFLLAREPIGVCALINPWNYPLLQMVGKVAPALAAGCTMIVKPAEQTPIQDIIMAEIVDSVGLPGGVFNLLTGVGSEIGPKMSSHPLVDMVSFTGSTSMGKHVSEVVSSRFGKTILELGGNNCIIVDETADMELVVPAIVFGAVGTAGQRCTSTRRVIIHESIFDNLIDKVVSAYKQVNIGDPLNDDTLMGPLINESSVSDHFSAIEKAVNKGGKLHHGGNAIEQRGTFVEPTIIEADNHWEIVQEETFTPILYVMRYKNIEEAIRMHNDVPQGLSSSIFTTNIKNAERFLSSLGSDCGIANVNIGTSGAEIGGAFGGEKETGGGRESGSDSWKQYMRRQTNTINWGSDLPLAQGIEFNIKD